jgi:hypothetical protein
LARFVQVDVLRGGNDGPEPLGTPAQPQVLHIPPQNFRANNPWVPPLKASPLPKHPPYPSPEDVVDRAGEMLFEDFAEANRLRPDDPNTKPNPKMFRFAFRVAYDWLTQNQPTLRDAIRKHRNNSVDGWRKLLGLPPKEDYD